ncbi:hypothetical protein H0I39_04035 [Ottowia beijingensis]|uniref:N6 adenine-specific DNA methyltransferase N-terminal domain-containing protein n=1 Tax=Ottowia beijingensis TaxID=1207057 RepID=A0A853IVS1_9BURK|nr:type I restriction-modification system subunit M N-terminal domain-containing protein [Ottowia beijingensis]NZA01140.1 hypothetical protein [Ottowia beijingensis]
MVFEPTPFSSFIRSVTDLLRGDYMQSACGKVIFPFTVLRRRGCEIELTKHAVLAELTTRRQRGTNPDSFLARKIGLPFFNQYLLNLDKLQLHPIRATAARHMPGHPIETNSKG